MPGMYSVPYAALRRPVTVGDDAFAVGATGGKSHQHAAPISSYLPDVGSVMGAANMGILGVALGVPIVGGAVNLVGKGAGAIGLDGTQTAISRVASLISAPHTYLFDPSKAITVSGLGKATGTQGIGSAIANGAAGVAAGTTGFVSSIPGISHANRWTVDRLSAAASRHHENALRALGGIPEGVRGKLGPEFTQAVAGIETGLGTKAALINADLLTHSLESANKIAGEAQHSGAIAALEKVSGHVAKAADRHSMASGLRDLPGAIRRAPSSVGKAPVGHAMNNGLILAGTALTMYSTAKGVQGRVEALREMYADLAGKNAKNITLANLFLEKVPQPVADARNHLIREFGPRLFLEGANAVMNASWILRGKDLGMITFFALQAGGQVMDALAGESILEYYKGFKDAQARGEQIPPDYYQAFLGLASPELRKRGGVNSDFAKALAIEYSGEQAGPKQIMQEVTDGKMHERIERLQQRYMHEREAHEKATVAIMQPEPPFAAQTHVDALTKHDGGKQGYAERARKGRADLGKYTGEIARESNASVAQSPVPGL